MAKKYLKITEEIPFKELEVKYPDKAEATNISQTIGIGILNSELKKGYIGHYTPWAKVPEELVDKAIKEAHNLSDLEIALVGNIPLSREEMESVPEDTFENALKQSRAYGKWLLETVKSKGIESKKIKNYLEKNPSNHIYTIFIDTEKGEMKVEKEDY